MDKLKKIIILIPCYNEEKGIIKVLSEIPHDRLRVQGYEVLPIVIDNSSTDKTAKVASEAGAIVIRETKKGKGHALKAGFGYMPKDTEFVVIIDGDNTYKTHEIPRLIEPLESNFADVIIGSRLGGKMMRHSLLFKNRVANWFYTFLIRQFYRANTTDVLSGFFAMKRSVLDDLAPLIISDGFSIEMELNIKISRAGYQIFAVPITYDVREGESKIDTVKDGLMILYALLRYFRWNYKRAKKNSLSSSIARESRYA